MGLKQAIALVDSGVLPGVGTVCDFFNDVLVEAVNGLYKADNTHVRGGWTSAGQTRPRDVAMGALVERQTYSRNIELPYPTGNRNLVSSHPAHGCRGVNEAEQNKACFSRFGRLVL